MKRWLRQHRYAALVAMRRLLAHPFSSLSNLLVIALTLAIPIIAASILASVQPVARRIPVSPEVTLFMKPGAAASVAADTASRIRNQNQPAVRNVRIVPRQQALARLKADPAWADALAALPDNPLPDAVIVTLENGPNLATEAGSLARQWTQWNGVDRVQLDSEWVRRLEAMLGLLRVGLAVLALGVALVVLATVFNTVRLQALMQREEIGAARLVGATESFVRRPFLYLGAMTGVAASLLAIGLAAVALRPLNAALTRLAQSYGTQLSLHLPDGASLMLAVILVAILAALSARWSVTRNTRF
ncbi:MAG: ABC transporter permease [Candidimonas sp.]|nr:MAG: ABC transporter permease [Candidimonas sp.]